MSYKVISRFRDKATGDYVDPSPEPWVPRCPKQADRLVRAGCLRPMPEPVAAPVSAVEVKSTVGHDEPKPARRRKRRNRQAD